jgi:hypothetical protein
MRDRLGSLENIMSKAPWNAPPQRAPTYIKTHTKYLEPETLRYYDLPWEYDAANPEYIVILQELDVNDTNILFEHTRLLREKRELRNNNSRQSTVEIIVGKERKERSKVASITSAEQLPTNTPPILGWAANTIRETVSLTTDETSIHAETTAGNSRALTDSLRYCLSTIEANLSLGKLDAPPAVAKRFGAAYAGGKMFDDAVEISLADLKVSAKFLEDKEWNFPSNTHTDIPTEHNTFISRDHRLVAFMAEKSRWILEDSKHLLDLFAGETFDNKVMRKCWGAVQGVLIVSASARRHDSYIRSMR